MALNKDEIIADFYQEMENSDRQSAARLGLDFNAQVNTRQKIAERLSQATAMGNVLFRQLTEKAEIVVPDHPSGAAMTGVASGPGAHVHTSNQPPISHDSGRIV